MMFTTFSPATGGYTLFLPYTVYLALNTPAPLLLVRVAWQHIAAAPCGGQVIADVFVVLGEAFQGIAAPGGGEGFP